MVIIPLRVLGMSVLARDGVPRERLLAVADQARNRLRAALPILVGARKANVLF